MLLGDVEVMVEKLLQRQSGNPLERDNRNGCRQALKEQPRVGRALSA